MEPKVKTEEKREYIRINTIFPVEFRLTDKDGVAVSPWLQGFSRDVAKGGICLFANLISSDAWDKISNFECLLKLNIHLPFSSKHIMAVARPVWSRQAHSAEEARFFVGLHFLDILPKQRKLLVRFAYFKNLIPKVSIIALIFLSTGILYAYYHNQEITRQNQKVVRELTEASLELDMRRQLLNQNKVVIEMLQRRLESLNSNLRNTEDDIGLWQIRYNRLKDGREDFIKGGFSKKEILEKQEQAQNKIQELTEKLAALNTENDALKQRLTGAQQAGVISTQQLSAIELKKQAFEKVAIEDMYKWIKSHQNLKTGLIASFEGDSQLSGWAFTYDQALCVNVFLLFKDFKAAEKVLDFYLLKAKVYKGGLINGYYADDGNPCEYAVHSGPNIWLGLSALRYMQETGQKKYLGLADKIAKFILGMQDEEGGVKGGPQVSWFATEHNLDAYAFFKALYSQTKNKRYFNASQSVRNWLKKYSYTRESIPINRAKGDSAIATDTYAWSIASLGPGELYELGMDPDQIIEFAVENCKVETDFQRKEGNVSVEGFDFSRVRNLPRGGVISSEWTAQMVLAFKIMEKFYQDSGMLDKSSFYKKLSLHYLNQMQKMVIASLSPTGQGKGCLPYASSEFVDTGHGWRTPSGSSTCSVAGTSYYILAYYGFNPLNPQLSKNSLSEENE